MRFLITGATGFIGRSLLPLLSSHEVFCLTRRPELLPGDARTRAIVGNLGVEGPWQAAVKNLSPECCIHLAWEGLPDYSLPRCRANLDAGVRLIEALSQARTRRVVVAGTCWEYGDASGAVAEDREPINCGLFAATKRAYQTIVEAVARANGFDYAWARVFFAYGPGQRPAALIPSVSAAYANGDEPTLREPFTGNDFVHVDDVASAIVTLTNPRVAPGVYNIGTGVPTSVADIVNRVAILYGRSAPFEAPRVEKGFWSDSTKIRATGWTPRWTTDRGVQQVVDHLRSIAAHAS